MTLQELRYLVALADHGHFGRAADACHVTQPTLSTQLKKLEDVLGVTLFERTNKSLTVTPIGRKIVDQARRVLVEAEAIINLARDVKDPLTGPFTLGVIPSLNPYLLPWLIPLLQQSCPQLQLTVQEDLTDGLMESLRAHRLDAAMVALPLRADSLEIRPLFDEPFFFACPRDHPLASAPVVSDADMRQQRILLLTDGHCLRDQALAICGRNDGDAGRRDADFRATSLETLRQMVAVGLGCTLLPALAVGRAEEQRFAVRPLATAAARRIGLVWRRGYPKGNDLDMLATLIRNALPPTVHRA